MWALAGEAATAAELEVRAPFPTEGESGELVAADLAAEAPTEVEAAAAGLAKEAGREGVTEGEGRAHT